MGKPSVDEVLFRALAEQAPTGMYALDGQRFHYVNPRCAEMLGRTVAEMLEVDLLDLVVPEERAKTGATIAAHLEHDGDVRYTTRFVRKDGTTLEVEVSGSSVVVDGRRFAIGAFVDATERAAARNALIAEKRRLAVMLETLPIGVWLHEEGKNVAVNDVGRELLRRGLVATTPPERWPIRRTVATGEVIVGEPLVLVDRDGVRAEMLASCAPIRDDEGNITGAIGALLDVTEQRGAERALDFERHRLATIFQRMPSAVAVLLGDDLVLELTNDAFRELVRERPVVGKPLREALPELVAQGFEALAQAVLRSGQPHVGAGEPIDLARRPGAGLERVYLDYVLSALPEADGTRTRVLFHAVDMTAHVVGTRRTRAAFKAMPTPTYAWQAVADDELVLVDYNDAAETITRGGILKFVGAQSNELYSRDDAIVKDMIAVHRDGTPIRREMDYQFHSTGERRRLAVTYTKVPPDIVLAQTEDITDRAKLEAQLRQAQKMEAVGQLAGGIAHDFNNILTVISTCAELLAEGLPQDGPLAEDVTQIRAAAERAATLTQQLLAFSRRQVLVPTVLQLADVVRAMEPMLRRLIGADIRIVVTTEGEPDRVEADRGQVEQVILNLVVNARDAMPHGGTLSLTVRNVDLPEGRHVGVAVKDTGIGMDDQTRARIFEPFFTTKEVGRGTGLGLSMAYGIAQQSGGTITVESRLGEGSTFELLLPRREGPAQQAQANTTQKESDQVRGHILLVEDEPELRAIARRVLVRAGYRVVDAPDGRQALALAEANERFDLVVTDVVMPELGGRDLAARLAERFQDIRVLYMSGYTDDEILRRGIHSDGHMFLQKPFTGATLLAAVRRALDQPS